VKKLKTRGYGQLTLGNLQKGEYAFLDEGSLTRIFKKYRPPEERKKSRPRQKSNKTRLIISRRLR